ncbi:MAG: hypothetical protein ACFFKA_14735, partial [Candidatus Thorarchaeota archaeon]
MKLKVKKISFESGNIKNVIINSKDAQELGQKAGERVILKNPHSKSIEDKYWVSILQISQLLPVEPMNLNGLFV